MKRTLQASFVVGLVLLAGSARAAPPSGSEDAKAHYARGVELYNDGAYSAALVELERAQSIAPYFGILHSIGLVKVQLADFVGGIAAFEEYLVAGGDEVPPQRKVEIREKLVQLQDRIGVLEVSVANGDGAEVVLDDSVVGVTPLAKPIRVNPGKHDVTVRRPGEKGESKKISVAGGDKLKMAFDLAAQAPVAPPAERPVAASGAPKWVVYTWIGAGAFAAGAITTGIIGLTKASDLKSKRDNEPTDAKTLDSLSSDVKTFGIVTDVLIVPAVILGSLSLYFTVRSAPSSDPAAAPKAATAPRTTVTFGGKSIGLRGSF